MVNEKPGEVFLTIVRYPAKYCFFALLAMALHRPALFFNRSISFWKLLGSGKGGGFSKKPDWRQWAILVVRKQHDLPIYHTDNQLLNSIYGDFIAGWYRFFKCETQCFKLTPISSHGQWDKQSPFGTLPAKCDTNKTVAVLTRATIRISKLGRFWQHVDGMNTLLQQSPGLLYALSIGELPFIKQATFSIWQNTEAVKRFAYHMREHVTVIQKTREETWYAEELFARFEVQDYSNTIHITTSI